VDDSAQARGRGEGGNEEGVQQVRGRRKSLTARRSWMRCVATAPGAGHPARAPTWIRALGRMRECLARDRSSDRRRAWWRRGRAARDAAVRPAGVTKVWSAPARSHRSRGPGVWRSMVRMLLRWN